MSPSALHINFVRSWNVDASFVRDTHRDVGSAVGAGLMRMRRVLGNVDVSRAFVWMRGDLAEGPVEAA